MELSDREEAIYTDGQLLGRREEREEIIAELEDWKINEYTAGYDDVIAMVKGRK
jgi:hypothetical protein